MHDPISDVIIRLKNAGAVGKESISVPYSKMKFAIAEVLEREGFVTLLSKTGKKAEKIINIGLIYDEETKKSKIHDVKRASKFSRRQYIKSKEIHSIRSGFGRMIITTPKGVMTGEEARKENLGGEVLFTIW
jgi:small subunit ribosomal protein S8